MNMLLPQSLVQSPTFGVLLTLLAYSIGLLLNRRCGRRAWVHPVLIGVSIVMAVLLLFGVTFEQFWTGGELLSFLMGPIVVALAIPLFDNLSLIQRHSLPILVSLLVGALVTLASAVGLSMLLGLSFETQMTMATKSVTSAIGMEVAEAIGGIAPLSALIILVTGIMGGVMGSPILNFARIKDPGARGMAYGLCAHAIGTAKAFEESDDAGAVAALAMSLMGVLCAFVLPLALG